MHLGHDVHLTYCTNIHAGETWPDVFGSLRDYVPPLKAALSPAAPFGVGLRLSDQASRSLAHPAEHEAFAAWLAANDLYVFTMNGFPYGGFHGQRVKDSVHHPDWTTSERRDYTLRLARILAGLPGPAEAGISTSPVSYRHWHATPEAADAALQAGCLHLAETVRELVALSLETGRTIHLDIEPEPDGLVDHVQDTIAFFNKKLIPTVSAYLMDSLSVKHEAAEALARTHLQLCYDVCHFAVMYEEPARALAAFVAAGIGVGKVQLSAALKADLPPPAARAPYAEAFGRLAESTYLHQVVARKTTLTAHDDWAARQQYPDLPEALPHLSDPEVAEWRTHFHVPVFVREYGLLQSTQDDILEVLALQRRQPFTGHLEVETYTWEVLPPELKLGLRESIEREMRWVMEKL